MHVSSPVCNRFLRFISGVTTADLMVAIMAAKPFQSTYLYAASQRVTRQISMKTLTSVEIITFFTYYPFHYLHSVLRATITRHHGNCFFSLQQQQLHGLYGDSYNTTYSPRVFAVMSFYATHWTSKFRNITLQCVNCNRYSNTVQAVQTIAVCKGSSGGRCNILICYHFPVHERDLHKRNTHSYSPLGLHSTSFSMYCTK